MSEAWHDRLMHAAFTIGDQMLLGSDGPPEHYRRPAGTYVTVSVDSTEEARRIFDVLAEGAEVQMPFDKTFWSPGFGMLVDGWGTPWMVNTLASTERAAGAVPERRFRDEVTGPPRRGANETARVHLLLLCRFNPPAARSTRATGVRSREPDSRCREPIGGSK